MIFLSMFTPTRFLMCHLRDFVPAKWVLIILLVMVGFGPVFGMSSLSFSSVTTSQSGCQDDGSCCCPTGECSCEMHHQSTTQGTVVIVSDCTPQHQLSHPAFSQDPVGVNCSRFLVIVGLNNGIVPPALIWPEEPVFSFFHPPDRSV